MCKSTWKCHMQNIGHFVLAWMCWVSSALLVPQAAVPSTPADIPVSAWCPVPAGWGWTPTGGGRHHHSQLCFLTHWVRATHIWVSKLIIIGSDNGLSPDRRQAIIWTNAEILLIGPLGTNASEIEIHTLSFTKMHLRISFGKWRPFCLSLDVLTHWERQLGWKFAKLFSSMKDIEF